MGCLSKISRKNGQFGDNAADDQGKAREVPWPECDTDITPALVA